MKTATKFPLILTAAFTALSATLAWAAEPLVLYDDFNTKLINPDKWFGRISGSLGNELRETVREIKGNRLHLRGRGYGRTDTGGGESGSGVQLYFTNPDAVAIQATIQVKDYELVGCGDSDTSSRVRARIVGSFFNTTADPTAGSNENSVWAQIRLQRNAGSTDAPNTLKVLADLFRCTDAACVGSSPVGEPGSADLGTAKVGEKVTLRLEWDQTSKRFVVQRGKEAEISLPYTVSDTQPPGAKFKRLEVQQSLVNCTTQPRPVGFIDAYFDDVYVNQ